MLEALWPIPEGYTDFEITWLTRLPSWGLILMGLILGYGLWVSYQTTQGAPNKVRLGLLALRAFGAVALFLILLEPGLRLLTKESILNNVLFVVDNSASMTSVHPERARKSKEALVSLEQRLKKQQNKFKTETWLFNKTAQRLTLDERRGWLDGVNNKKEPRVELASDQGTHFLDALSVLPASTEENPVGGVVIISDGADTQGLTDRLSPSVLSEVKRLGVPIHTVVIDDGVPFKDIAIEDVAHDEFAFVRNEVKVEVVLRQKGFDNKNLKVSLHEDGKEIAQAQASFEDGERRATVPFSFRPKRAGKRLYTVRIPVDPEERISENNRLDFTLKVIRDRIRVLQVSGHPSWDERFLRQLLKENPSVDLISFFILRTPNDQSGAPSSELSLIPFPTRQLFTEELHTFDIVIFQDFDYLPYHMSHYLGNIRDFVRKAGGGFMMIGGDRSFSEGAYNHTPIADILPVNLLSGRGHINEDSFTPLLTAAGKTHPITDLGRVYGAEQSFNSFRPLEGINRVAQAKEGAQTLLAHPFLNGSDGAPLPVATVGEYGKGRSMAILTDSTWMWSLPLAGTGGRPDAHRKFFANAMRWLIQDPELSRIRVQLNQKEIGPGERAVIEVQSLNEAYRLSGGAEVMLKVSPLDALLHYRHYRQKLAKRGKMEMDFQNTV